MDELIDVLHPFLYYPWYAGWVWVWCRGPQCRVGSDWDRISRQWAVAAARLGSTPSNPRCRVTISKQGILQSYRDLSTRRVSAMVTSRPMVLVLMGSRQMVTDPVEEHWSLTHPAQMTWGKRGKPETQREGILAKLERLINCVLENANISVGLQLESTIKSQIDL